MEENEDVIDTGIRGEFGCDVRFWRLGGNAVTVAPVVSSSLETGCDPEGDAKSESSLSETCPLPSDAAKLLDISGSDT
jgi:hypothetical protein